MQQEDDAHQRDDERLLEQRSLERVDGAVDQLGTVIDRLHRHSCRQPGGDLPDAGLQVVDHFERVLAMAGHRDAGYHLALAVQLGQPAPLIGHDLDAGDVADQHRRAALALDDQRLDVAAAAQVAPAAHHVLGLGHFDDAAADVAVRVADHLRDLHQRDAVGTQLDRIDGHLVGLHEATDRGDLGDALRLAQLVAHVPVLDRAQLGQGPVAGKQDVLIDPADATRIRSE
ncbi:MAG: hypothetical protein AW08_03803 [Candidatus Accumulibacter adjunctus]|uniref:Uncharacterized protein n=1 Tax=Candidatus Accumulibacter adjunctus TaxID=1454001 RepID=A0A011M3I2_9PROT|nr:MAG: hypothetical protein AW08_03803 [Candidatus Accumulibacter adjunctus]